VVVVELVVVVAFGSSSSRLNDGYDSSLVYSSGCLPSCAHTYTVSPTSISCGKNSAIFWLSRTHPCDAGCFGTLSEPWMAIP
jgi:hypothetical protein